MKALDYKIKVMEACKNGMTIQYRVRDNPSDIWFDIPAQPIWNWPESDYRIKGPEAVKACPECGKEMLEHDASAETKYAIGDYCSELCADVADLRYLMDVMEKHNVS